MSRHVRFPGKGFAPTRVTVEVSGGREVRLPGADSRDRIEVRARATAELTLSAGADFGMPANGEGGGYDGPLAYRQAKPMRPHVALAFDRIAAAGAARQAYSCRSRAAIAPTPSRQSSGPPTPTLADIEYAGNVFSGVDDGRARSCPELPSTGAVPGP